MLELFRLLGGSDSDENSQDVAPKRPRRSMVDPAAWDQFWHDELTRGTATFVDMFCSEGRLIDAMRANRLKTVLCVGNGISQEPRALARAGFDVTALDLSPFATRMAAEVGASDELLAHLLDGRSPRRKGRVQFVTGDLGDSALCPGPY